MTTALTVLGATVMLLGFTGWAWSQISFWRWRKRRHAIEREWAAAMARRQELNVDVLNTLIDRRRQLIDEMDRP